MTQMTNAQARVIDPVLSNIARGFTHNEFVANVLFPRVDVGQRGGKIITFGREDFQIYQSARAPGQNTKRVSFGYSGANYSLVDYSLEGVAPIENMQEANAVPGIDLGRLTLMKTDKLLALQYEVAAAAVARLAASYAAANKTALSGAARWDQTTATPRTDILGGREAVRAKIGKYPNVMLMGPKPRTYLAEHSTIRDQFKYVSAQSVTNDMIAKLFDIPYVVTGQAVYLDSTGTQTDVWGTDVILAYVDVSGLRDMGSPSAFYGYNLNGYPAAEEPYYDRNSKSWIYPFTRVEAPVMAGANGDGAFLIQTASN